MTGSKMETWWTHSNETVPRLSKKDTLASAETASCVGMSVWGSQGFRVHGSCLRVKPSQKIQEQEGCKGETQPSSHG